MAFQPPNDANAKERIYLYGGSGAGKSWAWLTIANLADKTGSDAQFHVIDTDRAAQLAIDPGGDFHHLADRIHIHDVFEWEEYLDASKQIVKDISPNDWIIIDMLSNAWELLPGWWIQNVFQENQTDYWATQRRVNLGIEDSEDGKGFGGMKGGVDWVYIGKVYKEWEMRMSMGARCHVMALAAESEISDQWDKSGEQRATYKLAGGFKPVGEKRTPHRFHSTMRIRRVAGETELFLVRDRYKEAIWQEKATRGYVLEVKEGPTGFAMAYLKGIRGWRL